MLSFSFSFLFISAAIFGSYTTILGNTKYNGSDISVDKPFQKCWELPLKNNVRSIVVNENQIILTDGLFSIRSLDITSGLNLWSTEVGGEVISDLLLVGKTVFLVVSQDRSDEIVSKRALLVSINIDSGITNANIELPLSKNYSLINTKYGLISAAEEGSLFLIGNSLNTIYWKKDLGSELRHQIVSSEKYVATIKQDKSILVMDTLTGEVILTKLFEFQPEAIELTNTIDLFVGDSRGMFRKINLLKDIEEWSFKTGGAIKSIQIVDDSLLINSTDNFIYKISVNKGIVEWRKRLSGRVKTAPLIRDDKFYHAAFGEDAFIVSLTSSGKTINKIDAGNLNNTVKKPILSGESGILLQYLNELSLFDHVSCKK